MSIIYEKFNSKIDSLKIQHQSSKGINHQGIKGSFNEIDLSTLIQEAIPKKYKVSKGIIENSNGEQSNETDIFIYNDEIIPPYIKNDLAFAPIEAIKYIFEVKTKIDKNEIKSTIKKFENFRKIGGTSPTVLYSYSSNSQKSDLKRYKDLDENFYTNPAISVLCISGKCYYYKSTTEHYIKDYIPTSEVLKKFGDSTGLDIKNIKEILLGILYNNEALEKMDRSTFANYIRATFRFEELTKDYNSKKLTINNINYNDLKFKAHQWIGIESSDNEIELALISGISNTLSQEKFGKYLLSKAKSEFKVFATCYEDHWGNLSCIDFDEKGLDYDTNSAKPTITFSQESNSILFERL